MSVQEFFNFLSQHTIIIIVFYIVTFGLSFILSQKYKKSPSKRLAQILSLLIFLVCIPGIMAALVVFYSLFFVGANLLEVNIVVYFLPIIMMVVSLIVISKNINLNKLPGFNRLSGLMTLLLLTGIVLLMLYKLRFLVGFFASIQSLVIIGIILYFVFKVALKKLSGGN